MSKVSEKQVERFMMGTAYSRTLKMLTQVIEDENAFEESFELVQALKLAIHHAIVIDRATGNY